MMDTAAITALAQNWSFGVYLWVISCLCVLMLGISFFLGARNRGRAGQEPFESGIVSVGGARLRFSAKFYLVAMMFVIFDAEALFLYAWAVCAKEVGWAGFIEVSVFIGVLLVGLVYLWRVGALDWGPHSHNKEARRRATSHKKQAGEEPTART